MWQLLPTLEKLMKKAGDTTLDGVLVGLGSVFLFLELLYQAVPPKKDAENGEPNTASNADNAEQSHAVGTLVPGTGVSDFTHPSARR